MGSVLDFLLLITKISLSQYETNFLFTYSVNYSLPSTTGAYFSSRINEAMNFSSITTGVTRDFYMKTSFASKDDTPLSLVHANTEMANPNSSNFIAYQRDFFDAELGENRNRYKGCSDYFADCSEINSKTFSSMMEQGNPGREDYYLINANLQTTKKEGATPSNLTLHFGTEASVTLLHVKMSLSVYYLILTGIGFHSLVLLFNVVNLMRKRNALQAVITKHKAQ